MLMMMIELVAARMIAPVLGSSLYTWTSVIGVILAGISLGNALGGRVADQGEPISRLIRVLLSTGVVVGLIPILYRFIPFFAVVAWPLLLKILVATFFLFFPAAFVGGMILPLVIKVGVRHLTTVGTTAGQLYAINVVGSIAGTFLAGFFLIGSLGSVETMFVCSVGYLLLAFLLPGDAKLKFVVSIITLGLLVMGWDIQRFRGKGVLETRDTNYYHLWVVDQDFHGDAVRSLYLDADWEGAQFRDREGLVHAYSQVYTLTKAWKPDARSIVFLGGGPHVSPTYFHDHLFPNAQFRVVEIDPSVTEAAKKYFHFQEDDRMTTVNEDARLVWRNQREPVDIIAVDVFDSLLSPPFHLITQEYHQELYDHLTDGGVVVTNIIDGWGTPEQSRLIRSYLKTVQSVFDAVWLVPTEGGNEVQNFVVFATKGTPPRLDEIRTVAEQESAVYGEWIEKIMTEIDPGRDAVLLTDNFSPVEQLMTPGLRSFNQGLSRGRKKN
jgi:spermidine synthase